MAKRCDPCKRGRLLKYCGDDLECLGIKNGDTYPIVLSKIEESCSSGESGGVISVTGDGVDNSDPQNPIVNFQFGSDIEDAINNSSNPSGTNPFVTINDLNLSSSNIVINVNFEENPLSSGSSLNFTTTLMNNSAIYELEAKGTSLDGDKVSIGIEVDDPNYVEQFTSDINENYTKYSFSNRTTIPLRNIIITAVGADITTGELKLIIKTI